MVDSGCKKIQVKGERRRTDGEQTENRRGTDEGQKEGRRRRNK